MKNYSELSGKKLKVLKPFDIYNANDIVDVVTAHQQSFTIRKSAEHVPMTINFGRNAFQQYFQVLALTSFEQKLALLHAADIYAHGEVSGKFRDLYRTSRFDTDCIPEHGCGYHEEGSDAERNPSLL